MFKKIIILFVFVISTFSWSKDLESLIEPIETLTEDGVLLKGIHLKNEGGKPLVALHGFMENTRVWREVAIELHNQGYDIYLWNMRGHGNGSQKSSAVNKSVKYIFDNIVSYDVPAMIDYVYKRRKEKIIFAGHSMGTMTARLTFSGVRKEKGRVTVSPAAKGWATKRIESIFAFGSPTTFESGSKLTGLVNLFPDMGIDALESLIRNTIKTEAPFESNGSNNFISKFIKRERHRLIEFFIRNHILSFGAKGVVNYDNLNQERLELARFLRKGVSIPPRELLDNARFWMKKGYRSLDGKVDYEHLPLNSKIPYVFIAGGKDKLADPSHILQDFLTQTGNKKAAYVLYPEFSHIDLVSGEKGGVRSARLLHAFVKLGHDVDELEKLLESEGVRFFKAAKDHLHSGKKRCKEILKSLLK